VTNKQYRNLINGNGTRIFTVDCRPQIIINNFEKRMVEYGTGNRRIKNAGNTMEKISRV
jgi:hypothetical protein